MKLITRKALDWPASAAPSQPTARGVKVHWLGQHVSVALATDHSQCIALWKSIRAAHLANRAEGYSDIAYNRGACVHGYVLEGRGPGKRAGANGNQTLNRAHYAIVALIGDEGLTEPTGELLHALRDGIEDLQAHGAGNEIKGHKDGYPTQCPGPDLYAWVRAGAPRPGGKDDEPATATAYTVQKGDTLSGIGRALGVDWRLIAAQNDLTEPYLIHPGDKLIVPGAKPPARPVVDLSKLVAAAKADPPRKGTPVSYPGVKTVEAALVAERLLDKQYADGHFGTATVTAYAAWQRRLGYRGAEADGIPGKTSLTKLGKRHGFDVKE